MNKIVKIAILFFIFLIIFLIIYFLHFKCSKNCPLDNTRCGLSDGCGKTCPACPNPDCYTCGVNYTCQPTYGSDCLNVVSYKSKNDCMSNCISPVNFKTCSSQNDCVNSNCIYGLCVGECPFYNQGVSPSGVKLTNGNYVITIANGNYLSYTGVEGVTGAYLVQANNKEAYWTYNSINNTISTDINATEFVLQSQDFNRVVNNGVQNIFCGGDLYCVNSSSNLDYGNYLIVKNGTYYNIFDLNAKTFLGFSSLAGNNLTYLSPEQTPYNFIFTAITNTSLYDVLNTGKNNIVIYDNTTTAFLFGYEQDGKIGITDLNYPSFWKFSFPSQNSYFNLLRDDNSYCFVNNNYITFSSSNSSLFCFTDENNNIVNLYSTSANVNTKNTFQTPGGNVFNYCQTDFLYLKYIDENNNIKPLGWDTSSYRVEVTDNDQMKISCIFNVPSTVKQAFDIYNNNFIVYDTIGKSYLNIGQVGGNTGFYLLPTTDINSACIWNIEFINNSQFSLQTNYNQTTYYLSFDSKKLLLYFDNDVNNLLTIEFFTSNKEIDISTLQFNVPYRNTYPNNEPINKYLLYYLLLCLTEHGDIYLYKGGSQPVYYINPFFEGTTSFCFIFNNQNKCL